MSTDIIIDYETVATGPTAAVLELGAVSFDNSSNSTKEVNFQEMVDNGFRVKFDLKSQKGARKFDAGTILWWRKQSLEAQSVLIPSPSDVTVEVGHKMFLDWVSKQGLDRKSRIWCRGNSFDLPILVDCLASFGVKYYDHFKFWTERDVRTRIEALLGDDICECPLPKGSIDGFVMHNGVHDCAKDVMMMHYAWRYAFGVETMPTLETADPNSLPKKRYG